MHSQSGSAVQTLLVVDDDARNRALVRAILPNYVVVEAPDGPTAISMIAREPGIDLVLLDVMMPGMSGYEACREIKAISGSRFLPVLMLTSLDAQSDRNQGFAAGADDFITKPFDRQELANRVASFLRLRQQDGLITRQLEELKRLTTFKDDLVSLIVHDLRNPLSGMIGFLNLLKRDLTDAKQRDWLQNALDGGKRLRETLDDLLEIRIMEDGVLGLQRLVTSVAQLAVEAAATLRGDAADHGVDIAVAAPGEIQASVDRKLVRRAIENLVSNALKYSPRGAAIELAVRKVPRGVEIDVADRGPGVPDAFKDTLFRKFASVETKRGSERRGHGLGLYLVRLVASAHGGGVAVHDRPDGGALFRLSLPAGHA